jgi:hypothetical protein
MLCLVLILCTSESVYKFFMSTATNDSNDNKNSHTKGNMLSLLNTSLHASPIFSTYLYYNDVILHLNTLSLSSEVPQKIIPYDTLEWKESKETNYKTFIFT